MTNTYDGAGDNTVTVWEDRDGGGWLNSNRDVSTFDGNGRLLTIISQTWDTDHWVNETRSGWVYDGSNQVLEVLNEEWDGVGWANSSRITFTYSDGLLETSTFELWDEGAWQNLSRSTFSYDGSNRVLQVLSELWQDGAWVNLSRSTSTYDGTGQLTQMLSESWVSDEWMNSSLFEFTYDGSGNEIVNTFSTWTGTEWFLFEIDSSMYENNKRVEVIRNSVFGFPTTRTRTSYFYDGEKLTEEIDQSWLPGLAAASWANSARTTYEYEAGGTAVLISDTPAPAGYELNQNYPNPFNPSTSIRYSLQRTGRVEITVYNMLGQAVKTLESGVQAPGVYETTWDGTDAAGYAVASGIYLYRVATDDFTETRKMMLLK